MSTTELFKNRSTGVERKVLRCINKTRSPLYQDSHFSLISQLNFMLNRSSKTKQSMKKLPLYLLPQDFLKKELWTDELTQKSDIRILI